MGMECNSWSDKVKDTGLIKPVISFVSRLLFVLSPSSSLLPSLCFLHCSLVLQILKHLFVWQHPADPISLTWLFWWRCPFLPKFIYWAKLKICLAVSPAVSKCVMRDQYKEEAKPTLLVFLALCFHFPMSNKLAIMQLMLSELAYFASSFLI